MSAIEIALRARTARERSFVMPGLVPGIHAMEPRQCLPHVRDLDAWMAGTRPAMTEPAPECRLSRLVRPVMNRAA